MCTVILGVPAPGDGPLILAANRDERLGRPSAPPEAGRAGALEMVAPRDLEAGGTWLGVNARGVLVAITNRFGHERAPDRRSRGLVVLDALERASALEAAGEIAAADPARYNPFHLLIADGTHAALVFHDGARLVRRVLAPGWHVVTERSFGAAPTEREHRLSAALERGPAGARALLPLLAVHAEPPFESTCVHLPELGYGTRSSTVIALDPADPLLLHAEGPPCSTPYEDRSALLRTLLSS